jgi:hypothetical protein
MKVLVIAAHMDDEVLRISGRSVSTHWALTALLAEKLDAEGGGGFYCFALSKSGSAPGD